MPLQHVYDIDIEPVGGDRSVSDVRPLVLFGHCGGGGVSRSMRAARVPRSASRLPPNSHPLCWPPYDPRPALKPCGAPKGRATCVLWPNTALSRSAPRPMADRGACEFMAPGPVRAHSPRQTSRSQTCTPHVQAADAAGCLWRHAHPAGLSHPGAPPTRAATLPPRPHQGLTTPQPV